MISNVQHCVPDYILYPDTPYVPIKNKPKNY